MSKLDKLINQIRNTIFQSVLSPELIKFRELYSPIYEDKLQKNNDEFVVKGYNDIFKFFNISNKKITTTTLYTKENSSIINNKNISKLIELDNFDYKYYSKKEFDLFSWMFFSIFCNNYLIHMNMTDRNQWLKQIKYDILIDFNKYDLYKKYSYNENFKKADLDNIFGMNQSVPIDMIRIYADVCNINCIIIENNSYIKYSNICHKNRATWLIVESDNGAGWYNIIKKKNSPNQFLRYNEINDIVINNIKNSNEINDKSTLEVLQNYAKGLGIDPKKEGKIGKKNKLKSELIDEINKEINI